MLCIAKHQAKNRPVGFRLCQIQAESKSARQLSLQAIGRIVPPEDIEAVLAEHDAKAQRERKLNGFTTVLLVIAMSIFTRLSTAHVLKKIAQGLRFVRGSRAKDREPGGRQLPPLPAWRSPIGCPLPPRLPSAATPDTPGACLFGRRLMAIDGAVEDIPDTPENAAAFERCRSHRAYVYPSEHRRRRDGEHLLAPVIEYTFDDPGRPGHGERHRLVTALLDPQALPARDLICSYHERWEIEIAIDEFDTHQRLLDRPLRSQRPVGVIQELYGLLIAHDAVRFLMHEAALQAGAHPDRISFTHALRALQDAVREFEMTAPEQLARLYAHLSSDIADELVPARHDRIDPPVVKRKMSYFELERPEHDHWPQPVGPFGQAVAPI